jgi:hypothetical protein
MKEPPPSARVTELRVALKALMSTMESAVRATAVDPNEGASDAAREETVDAHFTTLAELLRDPETPQGEKVITLIAAVHARLERTFRLYVRAAAGGKQVARKEMRRVLSEVKTHAHEWQ